MQRGERSEHPTPPFSYPDFVDLRDNTKTFSGLIGYHDDFVSITGSAKPERIYGALTSADFFEVLGVQPILGTSLISTATTSARARPIAVLSYSLWQKRFAGDQAVSERPSSSIFIRTRLWAWRRRAFEDARVDCGRIFFFPWEWTG